MLRPSANFSKKILLGTTTHTKNAYKLSPWIQTSSTAFELKQ